MTIGTKQTRCLTWECMIWRGNSGRCNDAATTARSCSSSACHVAPSHRSQCCSSQCSGWFWSHIYLQWQDQDWPKVEIQRKQTAINNNFQQGWEFDINTLSNQPMHLLLINLGWCTCSWQWVLLQVWTVTFLDSSPDLHWYSRPQRHTMQHKNAFWTQRKLLSCRTTCSERERERHRGLVRYYILPNNYRDMKTINPKYQLDPHQFVIFHELIWIIYFPQWQHCIYYNLYFLHSFVYLLLVTSIP